MAYRDHYANYLEELQKDIEFCKATGCRVVFGYTSDLDIVFQYDETAYSCLLEEYLKETPRVSPEDSIDSLQDLARITAAYLLQGDGGEIDITVPEVCDYLNSHFSGVRGLGGTGAQGAAALAAVGMPLLAHISDKCQPVCELMNYPELYTIKDGRPVPIMEIATDDMPVYHMILQYTKGDTFRIGQKTCTVPLSNRLIMDYDTIHKDLRIDPGFQRYLEEHAEQILSYNISGLNAILDVELLKKRLQEADRHYRTLKERNPSCIFYFESAHYLSPQVKHEVYHTMARYVDILGMNEEELAVHTQECGESMDKHSLPDILRALELVLNRHKVNGIILHTKDYSMYYGKELRGVKIEKGLTIGNLMASTRARTGRYGTLEDCRETLACPLSETGLRFARELDSTDMKHSVCLVPSRYMEKPKYTIGLGDTFVAGVQCAFIPRA